MTAQPLLRIRHMSKTFGADTKVLDDVSLDLMPGEVVAIVGHNGSGKSTLVKILAGFHKADPGCSVQVGDVDEPAAPGRDPEERLHIVHQDLGLIVEQTTTENLAIGKPWKGAGLLSPIRRRAEHRRAAELVAEFGGSPDVDVPIGRLLPAERTIVAIARSLDGWTRPDNVLVLDEPTATLHRDEALRLLVAVRHVAQQGGAVLFISHRLEEVTALADRVIVLRDGRVAGQVGRESFDQANLVRMIVGTKQLENDSLRVKSPRPRTAVLAARGITGPGIKGVDLEVGSGEILGVAGLSGSGRDTIGALLAGVVPRSAGTVTAGPAALRPGDVAAAIAAGVAFVPADRRRHGAIMELSVRENLTLPQQKSLRRRFRRLDRRAEREEARSWSGAVGLRPMEPDRRIDQFSGGNQQKVVLAKWLRNRPSVLIMDEPTQGVDVGAKVAIYRLLCDAADSGVGIILCSSDEKELVTLCDRVIVFADGSRVGEFAGSQITAESLVMHVIGIESAQSGVDGAPKVEAS